MIKSLGRFLSQVFFNHARHDVVGAAEKVSQANAVTIQRAPGVSFNQRQAGAMKDRSGRSIKDAIDLRGLRKVCNLCGAAIVGHCRQQEILYHGAQGHVGTETIWLAQGPIGELVGGAFLSRVKPSLKVGLLTCALRLVLAVLISSQRMPGAVIVMPKQGERILGWRDLSMIAGLFQFTAAIYDSDRNVVGATGSFRV